MGKLPTFLAVGNRIKAISSLPFTSDDLGEATGGVIEQAQAYTASVWAYRCINIRANGLANIPFDIVAGEGENETPVGPNDPFRLAMGRVAGFLGAKDLLRATSVDLDLFGTAYWLKLRKGTGTPPFGIQRLNPLTMEIVADSQGLTGWVQKINGREVARFPRQDVVYFHTYNPMDDFGGTSRVRVALSSIQAGDGASRYLASFFENYAIPPLLLTSDQPLGDKAIETARKWWDRLFKGSDKQHKTGIVGGGLKPFLIGYPTKDLAMTEVLDNIRKDICAVFEVPPAIAGAWEAANYASTAEQRQSLYDEALFPLAGYIQDVVNTELAPEYKGRSNRLVWRFEELAIMQPDRESDARVHDILVRARIEDPIAAAAEMGVTPPTPEGLALLETAQDPRTQETASVGKSLEPDAELRADLDKWERKVLKRIKAGKPARCEFESDSIPDSVVAYILGALEAVETADGARKVFYHARTWRGYP